MFARIFMQIRIKHLQYTKNIQALRKKEGLTRYKSPAAPKKSYVQK